MAVVAVLYAIGVRACLLTMYLVLVRCVHWLIAISVRVLVCAISVMKVMGTMLRVALGCVLVAILPIIILLMGLLGCVRDVRWLIVCCVLH